MNEVYFDVYGKVQKVMFRQTLMRGALARGLFAAASNDPANRDHVFCYLKGDEGACSNLLESLKSGMKLNSWGAQVTELKLAPPTDLRDFADYEVTTKNVDDINWSSGVEFYL